MYCGKCGTKNEPTNRFCGTCGAALPIKVNEMPVDNKVNVDYKKVTIISGICVVVVVFLMAFVMNIAGGGVVVTDESTEHLFDGEEHTRTIMIYMVGSNLEEDGAIASSDLSAIDPSKVDLKNINVLVYAGGTKKWHNFISAEENAIYELTESGFEKVKTYSKENMGDPKTLTTFLNYAYEHYPTQRFDLVFYNHGGAISGAVFDDFTGDGLSLTDFDESLKKSKFNGENKLETILFRTCLNGTYEIAQTFKKYAYYLVASEEVTLGSRLAPILGYINDLEATDTPISYGEKFINSYKRMIDALDPFQINSVPMYSIINLTKIDEVDQELDEFMKSVKLKDNYSDIVRVRSELYQYGYTFYEDTRYDMVDLWTLVEGIDDYASSSSEKLLQALDEAIEYNWSRYEHSKGLSIYFPYRGYENIREAYLKSYDNFYVSDNYYDFIKDFNKMYTSGNLTSFSKFDISESDTEVKENEFSLALTDEQVSDYAESMYVVFEKFDDYYMPVYSSDNTELEGNTLKTNVTNNLIKMIDKRDDSEAYVQLTERSRSGKITYQSQAVMFQYRDDFNSEAVNLYFDYDEDNKPFIASASVIESGEESISQRYVNFEDYDSMQITNYRYDIFDDDGKYTDKWVSNEDYYLFEVTMRDGYDLKRVSLDEGDYYCVFYVYDIYGNVFFSDLVSMNS